MDKVLANDDELTARKLHSILEERWPDLQVSLATLKHARKHDLGWICTCPKYCQLIRAVNKEQWLTWRKERIAEDTFQDVIWSGECSVQLDYHGRLCFRKKHQQ